jgi:2-haloacid dehalogenase
MERVKALIFDVFGTLVDWRGSIVREARAILSPLGVAIDWEKLADAWHSHYRPAMDEVRSGRSAFTTLDVLHRRNLDLTLKQFGLDALEDSARAELTRAWHRLDAWPDTAPCSNGNISIMVDLARRNGLIWDAILGAEVARDYKPAPVVYLSAAAAFDCAPAETMMVAAHSYDLAAATALGFRTAFIARPDEYGAGKGERAASVPVDLAAASLTALADRLLGA